jgi:TIGR03009 family protein
MTAPIMRLTIRYHLALISTGLLIVPTLDVLAQQSSKTGTKPAQSQKPLIQKAAPKEDPPAKAKAAAPATPAVDDEEAKRLDEILERWEAESSKIKSLHGKQSRSVFNPTFGTETVTEGKFFLEMPDKGRIDFKTIKFKPDAVSARKNKQGEPYKLESDSPQRWICDGESVLSLNDDEKEKTYQKEPIPPEQRGKNIVESPLPFLFGMKSDDAKRRFKLTIFQEDKEKVQLLVIPRMAKDLENYEKAAITLDKKTFLPRQVRMIDQSKMETIYTFESVVVNDRNILGKFPELFGLAEKDPFRPNLKGYKPVLSPDDQLEMVKSQNDKSKGVNSTVKKPGPVQTATPKDTKLR